MTVKPEGAVSPGGAVRVSGKGSVRAGAVEQLSRADRVARDKDARVVAPLESHAEIALAGSRDPVGLLLEQAKSRIPELVPVRHGRMLVSPFTFYRGAALPMAADLASTPASGLRVQLCGDAHLSNFGAFASPERRWSSTSTISMKPCPARSSGTSSGWPPAWRWRAGTTADAPPFAYWPPAGCVAAAGAERAGGKGPLLPGLQAAAGTACHLEDPRSPGLG